MMLTKMQTDIEFDKVQKDLVEKEQVANDIMRSLNKKVTIFANNILPPDKQQSVPGWDTGES